MEQFKQVQQGNTQVRLAVLQERLNNTRQQLNALDNKVSSYVQQIKAMIQQIKDKPNSVQQFISENWQKIVIALFALMGANATVIQSLSRVFTSVS